MPLDLSHVSDFTSQGSCAREIEVRAGGSTLTVPGGRKTGKERVPVATVEVLSTDSKSWPLRASITSGEAHVLTLTF
jgi:hypothetical protein